MDQCYLIYQIAEMCRVYLDRFLTQPGPSTDLDFVPGAETITGLETSKVLLVRQTSHLSLSFTKR